MVHDPTVRLQSVITCPACGSSREETMPTDACRFYWECPACHELIRPKPGDCCVYCSYGTVACPPVQLYPSHSGFRISECVDRDPGQGIATSNSKPDCEER